MQLSELGSTWCSKPSGEGTFHQTESQHVASNPSQSSFKHTLQYSQVCLNAMKEEEASAEEEEDEEEVNLQLCSSPPPHCIYGRCLP